MFLADLFCDFSEKILQIEFHGILVEFTDEEGGQKNVRGPIFWHRVEDPQMHLLKLFFSSSNMFQLQTNPLKANIVKLPKLGGGFKYF